MPGYVIHLAVAEEYLNKHSNTENYNEFINGVVAPDNVKDKSLTHYGKISSETNLYKYLKENKINTSYNKGFFLHLLTDYLFYNKYIEYISADIYNDYDILNPYLVKKYNVILPESVKDKVFYKEGNLKVLNKELVDKLISDISIMNIEDIIKEILNKPEEWTKIKPLKNIDET